TMVSFPASSAILKNISGLTDAQYGFIFIPQFIAAILGSVAGGSLARRIGLKSLLLSALLANVISQALLGSITILSSPAAFYAVLASTAMFGLAFGSSAAPLNTFPGIFFPQRRETALVALHTLLGIGLAAGPIIAGYLIVRGQWLAFPMSLLIVSALLAGTAILTRFPVYGKPEDAQPPHSPKQQEKLFSSPALWTFIAIVILYAFAEGTFSNWAVIYLHEERKIELAHASLALSTFWAMMAAGRLLVSVLLLKVPAIHIWRALPLLMIIGFLLLPIADSPTVGIALFAFAGLACSAFFPLSVTLVSGRFTSSSAFVSSLMIAALMSGVGIGSYVIGPLRSSFTIERLYQLSALYPISVFVLALTIREELPGDRIAE
ncbi:MAG: MFS transporter, partial [Nitrospirae bacterium]|nr:MFS transporter [Nitrospirota bacterium]